MNSIGSKAVSRVMAIICLTGSMAEGVTAQTVLTIEKCREMAIENNHEIMAAASKTESVRSTQKSYRANYLPTISANVIGAYSTMSGEKDVNIPANNEIPVFKPDSKTFQAQDAATLGKMIVGAKQQDPASQMAFAQNIAGYVFFPGLSTTIDYEVGPVLVAGVSLEQPIYMGGKIANATKLAGMGVEMAEKNEELTKANIVELTDQAYALVVKAKEMSKVAEKYNAVLKELMANVVKAKERGMKTGSDVLKVRVKLSESELAIQKAENGLKLAKMNLCHITGQALDSDIDVADEYPAISVNEGSVAMRPESAILSKKVEIAEAKTKIERSALLPEVGAMLSYNYVNGLKVMDEKVFNDGSFTALVKIKIPIFNCGKSSNKVKAAKSTLEETRLEQQNLTEKMELELQRAKNNMSEAEKESAVAEKALEEATENMRASKSMYDNGVETLTDYMEAQLLWQQAMATKVNADYQLYLSKVDMNRAGGTLLK